MKRNLIQLDGSAGGGQILRSALSLSMLTGEAFRITGIRGGRTRPGLMRQHLTCVRAACEISGGAADGDEIGSTELVFRPGTVRAGSYHFAIGTAGSTGLLLQTLLPALLRASGPSELRLEGGTHNPMAPPYEFLERVFLPALRLAGAEVSLALEATGFAPAGGGALSARIAPCAGLRPLDLTEDAESGPPRLRVIHRHLSDRIVERTLGAARAIFPEAEAETERREPGPSAGLCCQVEVDCGALREITSSFGEHGVPAERVGQHAAKPMRDYLGSSAPVGRRLADQLLLPMALAGAGAIRTLSPGDHVATNIATIERFLPVRFATRKGERGNCWIEVVAGS